MPDNEALPNYWGSDSSGGTRAYLMSRLTEVRKVIDATRFGFPGLRWRVTDGTERGSLVTQTPAGNFVGLEPRPGERIRLETELVLPEQAGGLSLAGQDLHCHVFSRFPLRLESGGHEVLACADPPIARGRVMAPVLDQITPGRRLGLSLTIDVPGSLIAYGFRLAFSTRALRDAWHGADRSYGRLLLAADSADEAVQESLARQLGKWMDEICRQPASRLGALLDEMALTAETGVPVLLPDVHMVAYSHVDLEWLWLWEQSERAILAIGRRAADLLSRFGSLRFSFSQAAAYEVIRRHDPGLMARIRGLIHEGRWEPVSATWVEHDANLLSAESMIRQLVAGQRFTRRHLGATAAVCVAADTFGHPASLPQLLAKSGCMAYYHTRCHPLPDVAGPAYRWVGPDGSAVLGLVTDAYDGELLASRVAEAAIRARRAGLDVGLMLFDIDGHSGEEVAEGVTRMARLAAEPGYPPARFGTLREFGAAVAGQRLPVFSGVPPTLYEGTYTSQTAAKQANRRGESALQTAEALCCMVGLDRRATLRRAWRALLSRQNHDTIAGTAISTVYQHQAADLLAWEQSVRHVTEEATRALAEPGQGDFAVINPTGRPREEWVVVPGWVAGSVISAAGEQIPVQTCPSGLGFMVRMPPWGVASFSFGGAMTSTSQEPAPLHCDEELAAEVFTGEENRKDYFSARNRFFSVVVRGDAGAVVSLRIAGDDRELVAYGTKRRTTFSNTARPDLGLNVLQIVRERPHAMSAWHLHEVHTEDSLIHTGQTVWRERGPLRAVLRTKHTYGATTIVQDMTVFRDRPVIDVTLTVDWAEVSDTETGVANLKLACTPDLACAYVHAGAPAGVVARAANGQEYPMDRWLDVSDGTVGLALLTEDRYGYDGLGPRVRVSLLRGAYDPAAGSDQGRHTFRYSLIPHAGTWRDARLPVLAEDMSQPLVVAPRAGTELAEAPRPATTNDRRPSLPAMDPGNGAFIGAVKWADRGSRIVCRVLNWSGVGGYAQLDDIPGDTKCWQATLAEDEQKLLPVNDGHLDLKLAPWAIETIMFKSAAARTAVERASARNAISRSARGGNLP